MEKMKGESLNILRDNLNKMKQRFPEVFIEDKIDFEKLEQILGNYIDDRNERYSFNWNGKGQSLRISQTPSMGTLRPAKEDSKNWDTTENLYIEGDNLEVLKLLQKTYHNKIKMIYIDPPYNTGKDFVYKDDYKDNIKNYLDYTGQTDEEGKKMRTNTETSGRYHTDWLNMMYPRLRLARNLLTDDGVIFISIDDNEVHNLRKICDEIFGEDNFVASLPTIMNLKGNNDQFGFAGTHENTIVYYKNYNLCTLNEFTLENEELEDWLVDEYGMYKKGANLKATGVNAPREKRANLYFPIYVLVDSDNYTKDVEDNYSMNWDTERFDEKCIAIFPKTNDMEMSWRWSKKKFNEEKHNVILIFDGMDGISFYKKQRPSLGEVPTKKPKSIFYKPEYSSGNGTAELKELFDNRIFSNPKPRALLADLLQIGLDHNSIILDFFSGSSTTAHAVMQLNTVDGGNRKFIMVQLPEPTDEKSEAYKAGYKNIAEIGKERIRRAGEKILEEYKDKEGVENLDIGFKVFKLDKSNIKEWNPDYDNLQATLEDMIDNFVPGRTEEDVLYEIILKYGIDLTLPIEEHIIEGKKVFNVGIGALFVCLDNNITLDVVEGIGKLKEELEPEITRVVFKDNGFKDDSVKTNAILILQRYGIDRNEIKSI